MFIKPSVYPLKGKVQHYAWGGYQYIPSLLGVNNNQNQPFAEYWLGAHPVHSSVVVIHGEEKELATLINENKKGWLGDTVATEFGSLPYLLKVLDVQQMLSIQVHPDKASAQKRFEEENRAGIALTAYNRNYKDANHKPELMVALSDFWLLHGFKQTFQMVEVLSSHPDFEFLLDIFQHGGYEALYKKVMTMEQEEVNAVLQPVIQRILPLYRNGDLLKEEEDFWAARAADTFCRNGQYDRGIFSIYFFNLVHLKKGEGIYQPAGLPHAYLEGQNVEIMANSDNVLRAGLTDKYIDIAELLQYVQFEKTVPNILKPETSVETVYKSPAPEFELSHIHLKVGEGFGINASSAEIVLVLEGEAEVSSGEDLVTLKKGEAAVVTAGAHAHIKPAKETSLFRVAVPGV